MLRFPNHWRVFQDCILIKWFMTSFTGTNWSQGTICWIVHSWKEFADVLTNGDPKVSCFKFDQALDILATCKREAESWEENEYYHFWNSSGIFTKKAIWCGRVFSKLFLQTDVQVKKLWFFCRLAGGGISTLGSRFVHKITSVWCILHTWITNKIIKPMITAVKKQLCQEEKHVLGISHRDALNNRVTLLSIMQMPFHSSQNSTQSIKLLRVKSTCKKQFRFVDYLRKIV